MTDTYTVRRHRHNAMRSRRHPKLIRLSLLLLLALALVLSIPWGTVSFSVPVPEPNGYEDFLRAATLVPRDPPAYHSKLALQKLVSQSAEAYVSVEAGLARRCGVPITPSADYVTKHQNELVWLKHLTRCLIAKGKLAHMEGSSAEAVDAYAKAYRFANELGRGGLPLDYLVHISCKALVMEHLKTLIPSLTNGQRGELLALIERTERDVEDPRVVAQRFSRWESATFGFRKRLERFASNVAEAIKSRSWHPLRSQERLLASRKNLYLTQYVDPVSKNLRKHFDSEASAR